MTCTTVNEHIYQVYIHMYLILCVLPPTAHALLLHAVPPPTAVTISPPVGTIYAGASVTLTCTVEFSPSVDVPVTVNTVWTGPDMTSFTPTNPVPAMMENQTRYSITVTVDAVRIGDYTCQATVTSSVMFITGSGILSGLININAGMYIHLLSNTQRVHYIIKFILCSSPPSSH